MPKPLSTKRVALIEIGTNSTKLLVAEVGLKRDFETVHFDRDTTRIGSGLSRGTRIGRDGVDRTLDVIARFQKAARELGCEQFFAFSTYALRKASNAASVVTRLEKQLGCPVKILTGREEARFAYLSARRALASKKPNTVLLDFGGGSTEIVVARHGRIAHARSLALGAVSLTERFIRSDPIERSEFSRLEVFVDAMVRKAVGASGLMMLEPASYELVASGGSISTAGMMIAVAGRHGGGGRLTRSLQLKDLVALRDRCLSLTLRERKQIPGLDPKRADIIPAGLATVLSFMRYARKRVLYPNPGGVREGVLAHLIANGLRW
jgi:exopolyphosphatase/guanosine-5'-triphosphate,3'-diphosphate pyrophosphatase